ncbi:unnamed protein product [Paramecium primaurelia]|uniref:Tetratricopeptide repeat protein n=1 Tax=Paramecium primaurelia TaxID=5886 RepID=A0A8S1JNQ0_PARPR|nr:unnamed protein product [Paramecium primaurelia]
MTLIIIKYLQINLLMLIRNAVKRIFQTIFQSRSLYLPIKQQVYIPTLTMVPQYGFFFNGKHDKDEKQAEIDKLYDQMEDCENENQQMDMLRKIIEIREEMDQSEKKKCVSLLLDKIEYARYLIENQQMEDKLVQEVLSDDFLNDVHYNNVDLSKYPMNFNQFLWHNLAIGVIPLKYAKQYDDVEFREIEQWLKQYKESVVFIKNYLNNNFEEIGESEGYLTKEQGLQQYYYNLAFYYEMKAKLLIEQDQIQQGIKYYETALKETEKFMDIVKQLCNHENPEVANEAEKQKEKGIAKFAQIFEDLGSVQIEIQEFTAARPYFEKAIELYLQVFGKHSIQYAQSYCQLASTYQLTDLSKCEEMLKDFHEYLESFNQDTIYLEVTMNYFCILEGQERGTKELFIKIQEMREKFDIENDLLIVEYDIQAIKFVIRNGQFQQTLFDFFEESIQLLDSFGNSNIKAEKLLLLNELADKFVQPNNIMHETILESLLDEYDEVGYMFENNLLQYKVDRQKAFLQFRIRETLLISPEESLENFFSLFSNWIEKQEFLEMLFDDTNEMIQQVLDQKMLTVAHKLIKNIIDIMEEVQENEKNEYIEEALNHYKEEAQNIFDQITGK